MRDIFLVIAVAAVFIFGFFVMKRLDVFLEENRRRVLEKEDNAHLCIAFENPMTAESITPLLENFSRKHPDCEIHLFCGTSQEILKQIERNTVDFGLMTGDAVIQINLYRQARIKLAQRTLSCENIGMPPIQPIGDENISVTAVWKITDSSYINDFADVIVSCN